jgi:integrase
MANKGIQVTSSAISWRDAQTLILQLFQAKKYKIGLLFACGIYTGLRISDLLLLRWEDFNHDKIKLREKKTDKHREITVNPDLRKLVKKYSGHRTSGFMFINKTGDKLISLQYIDTEFKKIAKKYGIQGNFSTHSMRKTFGRHIWEQDNESERSLILLSKIFNHTHSDVTRAYLGITSAEIADIYINL